MSLDTNLAQKAWPLDFEAGLGVNGGQVLIQGFPAGAWGTNCYVAAAGPGMECVVIDPGQDSIDGVLSIVDEHRLKPVAVLLTHGHIDHIWSVAPVAAGYDIPAFIHSADRYRLADPAGASVMASREHLLSMTKGALELTEPSDVRTFDTSVSMQIAGLDVVINHAPGHTEGSVVLTVPATGGEAAIMFSGDVLFAGSIGRTDLPGGNADSMEATLGSVIWPCDDDTIVLPGHGQQTTIGIERASNPYLRQFAQGSGVQAPTRGM